MKTALIIIFLWLGIINFYGFLVFGFDKLLAKMKKRRISEHHLVFVSIIGGALGAYIGMQLFHHKTKKAKFIIWIPILCAVWLIIAVFAIYQYSNAIN